MDIDNLISSLPPNYSDVDRELILRAYRTANEAHTGQSRASGDPYITHCIAVAEILISLRVPPPVIAAGLLHDTVEDTYITSDDLHRDFGEEITRLVGGVTKLTELPRVSRGDQQASEFEKEEEIREIAERRGIPDPTEDNRLRVRSRKFDAVNETLRKTFLAIDDDPRVPLIKLADRLHNMRTLHYMPEAKRSRIAQQTLDIFAPLASILGIWAIKWELEDLSFRYVNPEKYKEIATKLEAKRSQREKQVLEIKDRLQAKLSEANIQADISGRPKHIYSIFKKMDKKQLAFEDVHDIRGVRIIVPNKMACYQCLGIIHSEWRPVPGQIDDYIANPKDNNYQSIHTAVYYDDGNKLEVQIRTGEMHEEAEFGIAAHWRYKDGSPHDESFQMRVKWLRRVMDWRSDVDDASEFIEVMKSEVFQNRVYVFTPQGDVIDLPEGSTPIDFAYYIHTDVGHRCRGAKVNGKQVGLDYQLNTGDQVQVLTAKRGGPSRDWLNSNLNMVKSARARGKIKHWFKQQKREENILLGRALLEKELRRLGTGMKDLDALAGDFNMQSMDDLYAAVGSGDIPVSRVINQLKLEDDPEFEFPTRSLAPGQSTDDVEVLGLRGLLVNMGRCCKPCPGDEIVGYITRGRGATIHRSDCPNILNIRELERIVRVSWGVKQSTYPVSIRIDAFDRSGLAEDVFSVIAREKINIADVDIKTREGDAFFFMVLEVKDMPQLSRVLDRIIRLPNVHDARRISPG